jgi:hypothetical protein
MHDLCPASSAPFENGAHTLASPTLPKRQKFRQEQPATEDQHKESTREAQGQHKGSTRQTQGKQQQQTSTRGAQDRHKAGNNNNKQA